MMELPVSQLPPGDPRLIEAIVGQLKSKGIFDQFRKECLSDVDTKPAFQNLRQRVENKVNRFLDRKPWKHDLNKNQLRESVRKHVHESGILDAGIDAIITQVVNPKIKPLILPYVEDTVCSYLQIVRPQRSNDSVESDVNNINLDDKELINLKLPPMETDVISSEEDDVLLTNVAITEPQVKLEQMNIEVTGTELQKGETVDNMAADIDGLHLHDTAAKPRIQLFDEQSLDSISSNSSGFSFSPPEPGESLPQLRKCRQISKASTETNSASSDSSSGTSHSSDDVAASPVVSHHSRSVSESSNLSEQKEKGLDMISSEEDSCHSEDGKGDPRSGFSKDNSLKYGDQANLSETGEKAVYSEMRSGKDKSDGEITSSAESSDAEVTMLSKSQQKSCIGSVTMSKDAGDTEKCVDISDSKGKSLDLTDNSKTDQKQSNLLWKEDPQATKKSEEKHHKSHDDHHSHHDRKHHRKDKDRDGDNDSARRHHSYHASQMEAGSSSQERRVSKSQKSSSTHKSSESQKQSTGSHKLSSSSSHKKYESHKTGSKTSNRIRSHSKEHQSRKEEEKGSCGSCSADAKSTDSRSHKSNKSDHSSQRKKSHDMKVSDRVVKKMFISIDGKQNLDKKVDLGISNKEKKSIKKSSDGHASHNRSHSKKQIKSQEKTNKDSHAVKNAVSQVLVGNVNSDAIFLYNSEGNMMLLQYGDDSSNNESESHDAQSNANGQVMNSSKTSLLTASFHVGTNRNEQTYDIDGQENDDSSSCSENSFCGFDECTQKQLPLQLPSFFEDDDFSDFEGFDSVGTHCIGTTGIEFTQPKQLPKFTDQLDGICDNSEWRDSNDNLRKLKRQQISGSCDNSQHKRQKKSPCVELTRLDDSVVCNGYGVLPTPEDDENRTSKDYEVDLSQRDNAYSPLSPSSESSGEDRKAKHMTHTAEAKLPIVETHFLELGRSLRHRKK